MPYKVLRGSAWIAGMTRLMVISPMPMTSQLTMDTIVQCGMKLLVFSDIHSDLKALERLMETEADYYFAAGDLCNWGRALDATGEVMKSRADRMYVIPGNHESADQISAFCARFGFHDFHGQRMQAGRYHIGGLGYSGPTPFDTPGEYTED